MNNSASKKLYNLLVTRDFHPEILDRTGKPATDPGQADMFSFDWKTPNKNYGTVVILLGDENNMEVYFGDNIGRSMEKNDRKDWYNFLEQMKNFAIKNNFNTFKPENLDRLKFTMQGMAAIKEGLFEGYYGRKKVSYSDHPKQTRLMIKHSRELGEGEARYRAIESLFVETADGERFKLPFKNLLGGKVMARHVSEGGNPYDPFGQYISQIVREMNILGRFLRATKDKDLTDEAQELNEAALRHYSDIKAKAKKMVSRRGYLEAREDYDPAAVTDQDHTVEGIRNLFIEQSLDRRIEEALPILSRFHDPESQAHAMKETEEFESWIESVTEGTWALPDTPESETKLRSIMTKPLPVGPDARNATEQLYSVFGDDALFDSLADLARADANADARPLIRNRLNQLGIEINLADIEDDTGVGEPNLEKKPGMDEDLDTDGVMMTKPSNMSSESVDHSIKRFRTLAQLA